METAKLQALTVKQPWAWALMHAGKDVENRTWFVHYRGPLIIHAAVNYANGREKDPRIARVLKKPHEAMMLPRGYVVGIVDMIDCVQDSSSDWADHDPGTWHWVFQNPRALREPIYCRGTLSLWNPPEEIIEAVRVLL